MSGFTDFLEDSVLDHLYGATAYTPPVTIYFGLSTTTIADDGTGITEPVGGSYARVAVTNNDTNFPAAVAGAKTNGTPIEFPTATALWGTVTDFFVADDPTAGNILTYGVLTTPKTIDTDDTASYAAGAFDLTLD